MLSKLAAAVRYAGRNALADRHAIAPRQEQSEKCSAARLLAGLPVNCYVCRMAVKFRKRRMPRTAAVPPRVTVDPSGDWRACTDTLPRGCAIMGTVSIGTSTGALVRLADSGNLVMVQAGSISMLNQRQARQLLDAAERTASETEMLPADLWRGTET
jgi:hypothetical protein